ncbi:MAG: Ppx/GppA family phosphatase [Novosphingobium sp.]
MGLRHRNGNADAHDQRAVIDIGSNTVRLVIYGGPPRAPVVLHNEKVTARLGKGVAEDGRLASKASRVALAGLARFAMLLRLRGVAAVDAVATAAVRDAENGAAFLDEVRALGLQPRLLTGEEEALTSARGVMAAFPGANGVVGDLGGGSLELIEIADGHASHGTSLPLGSLRLSHMRAAGGAKFTRQVQAVLATGDWAGGHAQPFYLVGGSWRALARYAMHQSHWPADDPHGYEMDPEVALSLARSLGAGKVPGNIPGLSASRAAGLPDAAALLGVLVRTFRPARLVFSSWGLREGLLYQQLGATGRHQDPMVAGISAFVEKFGGCPATAAMVAGWTARANPESSTREEALRLCATLLALASQRLEPNLRPDVSMQWALRKRWIGIDAEGRAMLAAAILANGGQTVLPEGLSRMATPAMLQKAVGWGLAIRLCRRLSGCAAEALTHTALESTNGVLALSVREPARVLVTETIEKDLRQLAGWLGLTPELRALPA